RIGLALSDPGGRVATPHAMIERSGDPAVDGRKILAHAREAGASRVVVGLPLSLSGDTGPAARAVLEEVDALRALAGEEVTGGNPPTTATRRRRTAPRTVTAAVVAGVRSSRWGSCSCRSSWSWAPAVGSSTS